MPMSELTVRMDPAGNFHDGNSHFDPMTDK
jgi:hypothetical protein